MPLDPGDKESRFTSANSNTLNWSSLKTCVTAGRRRLLGSSIDTIYLDVWTTLIPSGNYTAPVIWQYLQPPNARLWLATKAKGFATNITFLNATQYKVCSRDNLLRACPCRVSSAAGTNFRSPMCTLVVKPHVHWQLKPRPHLPS